MVFVQKKNLLEMIFFFFFICNLSGKKCAIWGPPVNDRFIRVVTLSYKYPNIYKRNVEEIVVSLAFWYI